MCFDFHVPTTVAVWRMEWDQHKHRWAKESSVAHNSLCQAAMTTDQLKPGDADYDLIKKEVKRRIEEGTLDPYVKRFPAAEICKSINLRLQPEDPNGRRLGTSSRYFYLHPAKILRNFMQI